MLEIALEWFLLVIWSAIASYFILFHALTRKEVVHHAPKRHHSDTPVSSKQVVSYSPFKGFKSFAENGRLTIDDIVKGLSERTKD